MEWLICKMQFWHIGTFVSENLMVKRLAKIVIVTLYASLLLNAYGYLHRTPCLVT